MATTPTVDSIVNDQQWAFIEPLLPPLMRSPRVAIDERAAFAAVVLIVTSQVGWNHLRTVFGITSGTAYSRFRDWTDADVWRQLGATAIGTPHAEWASTVAIAAIDRAGDRACGADGKYASPPPGRVDPRRHGE